MSNIQLRTEIGKLLSMADERLLASVYSMMRSYLEHNPEIVGYTIDGKPLTRMDLLNLVEESRTAALKGQVVGAEALLSEIETW